MASFNGATFDYRGQGGQTFPIWNAKQLLVETPRPNEISTLQDTGSDVQRFDMVIRCSYAELLVLYDQVLESGSLVMAWETHDAFLENLDTASLVVTGNDRYEATLHLIRL